MTSDIADQTSAPASRRWHRTRLLLPLLAVSVLAGCAAAGNELAGPQLPGFWPGLWHGLISPVTFWVSLFTDRVGVYAVRNAGPWYDAGFMLGVSTVFTSIGRSGAAAARGARRAAARPGGGKGRGRDGR